jgi:transposase
MKVQEVILRAMSKQISWWQAAEILGVSARTMRRWKRGYERYGFQHLRDRRRGKASPKKIAGKAIEQVLELFREQYFDFNVRHFHEKLEDEHGLHYSYTWVKNVLQAADSRNKRGV